ncbi:hypothetical protein NUSPORA_02639 [Nucleospora cyclopteri]
MHKPNTFNVEKKEQKSVKSLVNLFEDSMKIPSVPFKYTRNHRKSQTDSSDENKAQNVEQNYQNISKHIHKSHLLKNTENKIKIIKKPGTFSQIESIDDSIKNKLNSSLEVGLGSVKPYTCLCTGNCSCRNNKEAEIIQTAITNYDIFESDGDLLYLDTSVSSMMQQMVDLRIKTTESINMIKKLQLNLQHIIQNPNCAKGKKVTFNEKISEHRYLWEE